MRHYKKIPLCLSDIYNCEGNVKIWQDRNKKKPKKVHQNG